MSFCVLKVRFVRLSLVCLRRVEVADETKLLSDRRSWEVMGGFSQNFLCKNSDFMKNLSSESLTSKNLTTLSLTSKNLTTLSLTSKI